MKKHLPLYLILFSLSFSLFSQGEEAPFDVFNGIMYEIAIEKAKGNSLSALIIKDKESGVVIDSLMLIDGGIEILDYYLLGTDSISVVYEHVYPTLGKRVNCDLFLYDFESKLYSSRSINIFSFPFNLRNKKYSNNSPENNPFRNMLDEFFCKKIEIIDHNNLRIEKREALRSSKYIFIEKNLIRDVSDRRKSLMGISLVWDE